MRNMKNARFFVGHFRVQNLFLSDFLHFGQTDKEPYRRQERNARRYVHGHRVGERYARAVEQDIGKHDRHHEKRRNKRYPVGFLFPSQIHGYGPQREYGQCLVAPCEIAPYFGKSVGVGKVVNKYQYSDDKQRDTYHEPFGYAALFEMQEIGNDKACRAERGIAGGNGRRHDAEYG